MSKENKISELSKDVKQLKNEIQNDKVNTPYYVKSFISEQKWKIVTLALGIIILFNQQWVTFEIPEEVFVFIGAMFFTCIVVYPYVRWIVRYFIKDNRMPIFAIDLEKPHDIGLWYMPRERISDIEVEGEMNRINTKQKGDGYEVLHFEERIDENGKRSLHAKGNWVGEKTGRELKVEIENVKDMRENLTPLARKGMMYDIKWPTIIHSITSKVSNWLIHDFQGGVNYKGDELYDEIEQMIKEEKPTDDNETDNVEDISQEDIEALQKLFNNGEKVGVES
jgi:hypothetical protein